MSAHIPYEDQDLKNQIEIKDGDCKELLDEKGRLAKSGWARRPLIKYNPNVLSRFVRSFRLKEWNYYSIGSSKFYFAVAAVDLGYLTNYHTFFIDFTDVNSKPFHDEVISMTPFSKGLILPSSSEHPGEHINYKSSHFEIKYVVTNENDKVIHNVKIISKGKKGKSLEGDFRFDLTPSRESVVLLTPIGKNNFYFNQKTNLIPVSGSLKMNGVEQLLQDGSDSYFGVMDWGRGVWDYSSFWLWSTAWGVTNSLGGDKPTPIGLNFGSGFGNLSTHTENAINVDGVIHKLGHIEMNYDPNDLLKEWTFTCKHGRFGDSHLKFKPIKNKYEKVNYGLFMSSFNQIIGKFSGEIILDDDRRVEIDIYGFTEAHTARW